MNISRQKVVSSGACAKMAANEDSFRFEYGADFPAALDILSMAIQNRTVGHNFAPAELLAELNLAAEYKERTARRAYAVPASPSAICARGAIQSSPPATRPDPSHLTVAPDPTHNVAAARASGWSRASLKARWRPSRARARRPTATG